MKAFARLLVMCALCLFVVLPLGAAPKDKPAPATATFEKSATDALICLIECSNGDRTWEEVGTRGGCLDACESYCGEQCELVN